MKKIGSWRGKPLILFFSLVLIASFCQNLSVWGWFSRSSSSVAEISQDIATAITGVPNTVVWGSVTRLKHRATGKYLAAGEENYFHFRNSGQKAVYATDGKDDSQLWIVKACHSGDRWNCQLGYPVKRGDWIRLEHLKTGRNLHSHGNHPSPASNQQEVTTYGANGVGDSNDNWHVDVVGQGTRGVLVAGCALKLRHVNTNHELHSHYGHWFQSDKQEVTGFGGRDDNDWFFVELEQSPAQANTTKGVWQAHRGGLLNYNTIVCIDPINTGDDRQFEGRRLWTHGSSRHGDGNNEPHNHVEILSGSMNDARSRTAPSFFMLQNASNSVQTGPVKYGDKIKIVSLFAGVGHPTKSGMLSPFKYWWMNPHSRFGDDFSEIVISHPDHPSVNNEDAQFIIEPTYQGVEGDVYQNDIIQIRNVARNKRVLWVHWDSRWGNRYYELLANNNDDRWGRGDGGHRNSRDTIFHRFRIFHTVRPWLAGYAQGDLDRISESIKTFLGAAAAKQQAEFEKAKAAQAQAEKERAEAAVKAAQEEAKRLAATAAQQLADAQKKAEEAAKAIAAAAQKEREDFAKKLAEAAKVGGEALKKAQDQLNTVVAENAKKLAEAEKLKEDTVKATEERLKKEKEDALVAAQKAKELSEADTRKREEAMKAKFDAEAAEKQRQLDEATALAEELKLVANLPLGFIKVAGKAKKIAVGLREEVIAGKKQEVIDRWAIGMDDKLLIGTDAINPWTMHVAKDDKGTELPGFKDVAVGGDGIVYVVTLDGKAFQYVRPGKKFVLPAEKKPEKEKKLRGKAKRKAKKSAKKASKLSKSKKASKVKRAPKKLARKTASKK